MGRRIKIKKYKDYLKAAREEISLHRDSRNVTWILEYGEPSCEWGPVTIGLIISTFPAFISLRLWHIKNREFAFTLSEIREK